MNYELSNGDLKELLRLYPNIKVTCFQHHSYYLSLQEGEADLKIHHRISTLQQCKELYGDVSSYKHKLFDEVVAYFKSTWLEKFNNSEIPSTKVNYATTKRVNYTEGKIYVSIDLREANWNTFKKFAGIDAGDWCSFLKENFNAHDFVAESKSFRQFVLGNLNPGRQQSLQKFAIWDIIQLLVDFNIYHIAADEITLEFEDLTQLKKLNSQLTQLPTKLSFPIRVRYYMFQFFEQYGDGVAKKHELGENFEIERTTLFSVQGNRYFIHYKTLILGQEIEERDLFFEPEPKKIAKWIL